MKKIVFYDHNCKICTCFKNWAEKRSSYWEFLPNDEKSILDSGIDIDLSIPPKKIVCNDDELFFGAIAILKIFSVPLTLTSSYTFGISYDSGTEVNAA